MILFGGGARLIGPAAAYFGLGQFHLGAVELFGSVEESLRNVLPCHPLAATLTAHVEKDDVTAETTETTC